jgi:SAM-dependent MidA family methyltransferase
MQNGESTNPRPAELPAHLYLTGLPPATSSLMQHLLDRIRTEGALTFPEFMATALYDPERGYYARSTQQVGRAGDFATSVSVGPLFGELLARRFLAWWQSAGAPACWRILECGAHDGTLAADVLRALERLAPSALEALEYVISEPLPRLRAAQGTTLQRWHRRVDLRADIRGLEPLPGIVFGNELLDALPFHIVEWRGDRWQERRVTADDRGEFQWENHEIGEGPLVDALDPLGREFPVGYVAEIRADLRKVLEPLVATLAEGILVWIDYGFARPELYHPDRSAGTLRTFSKHRAGENPLSAPGEQDITAHVDFSAVAEACAELGYPPVLFRSQGRWLTEIAAAGWLTEREGTPDPAVTRQFQSLVHPGKMGARFHVLECASRDPHHPLRDEDAHRLAWAAP